MLAPASDFDDNNSIIFTPISMGADEPALSPHCPRHPVSHTSAYVTRHVARASCFTGNCYSLHSGEKDTLSSKT